MSESDTTNPTRNRTLGPSQSDICPIPKVRLGLLSDSDLPESDPSGIGPSRRRKPIGPNRTLSDSESPTRTFVRLGPSGIGSESDRTSRRANGARSDIGVRVGLCWVRLRHTPPLHCCDASCDATCDAATLATLRRSGLSEPCDG